MSALMSDGTVKKCQPPSSPADWLDAVGVPARDEATRRALAEAVAVVAHGRSSRGRQAIARAARREPALSPAWLRALVGQLNR